MLKSRTLYLLLTCLVLNGCGGGYGTSNIGTESVASDGTCTKSFLDGYNTIQTVPNNSETLKSTCGDFRKTHAASVNCMAKEDGIKQVVVKAQAAYDTCAAADTTVSSPPLKQEKKKTFIQITDNGNKEICSAEFSKSFADLKAKLLVTSKTPSTVNILDVEDAKQGCNDFKSKNPNSYSCTDENGNLLSSDDLKSTCSHLDDLAFISFL